MKATKAALFRWPARGSHERSSTWLTWAIPALLCLLSAIAVGSPPKKPLDQTAVETWPTLNAHGISPDGKFVAYSVSTPTSGTSLFVQNIAGDWKCSLGPGEEPRFTEDSRRLVFGLPGRGIGIVDLAKQSTQTLAGAGSFKVPAHGTGKWLAYLVDEAKGDVALIDLATGKERHYLGVKEYQFNDGGEFFLIWQKLSKEENGSSPLVWLALSGGTERVIDDHKDLEGFVFSDQGDQLAYGSHEEVNGTPTTILKYYRAGMEKAVGLVKPDTRGMNGLMLSNLRGNLYFGEKGDRLFFQIQKPAAERRETPFRISSFDDRARAARDDKGAFLATYDLATRQGVVQLEHPGRSVVRDLGVIHRGGSFVVLEDLHSEDEISIESANLRRHDYYLESTRDASIRLIKKDLDAGEIAVSPGERYVMWFDCEMGQWCTYEIASGAIAVISCAISGPLSAREENAKAGWISTYGPGGWLEDDQAVLLYDRNDIWQADPSGKQPAINLTAALSAKGQIRCRRLDLNASYGWISTQAFSPNEPVLVSSLDLATKQNGFYRLSLASNHPAECLSIEPMTTFAPFCHADLRMNNERLQPIKARNADVYLVKRSSPSEYPNLSVTRDFKTFTRLTNLAPQEPYNWYSTELVRWQLPDGNSSEGILFKPQDFDPAKKYPLIFYYYEGASDQLHVFFDAENSDASMNVPYMVSHGYLVFVPDIHYVMGHPGQSACDAVESAARALAKKSFVDSKRMGLQGHSHGGFETNYIVTHSNLFSAAVSGDGVSDLISSSLANSDPQSGAGIGYYRYGQGRLGVTLWEKPELFIENSAIFRADKVTTPLLIVHGGKDSTVPYLQGLKFFNALALHRKKVWLLSYKEEGHIIDNPDNQRDFTARLMQFFDHYLKGEPPPKWMTTGYPGLELDTSGQRL